MLSLVMDAFRTHSYTRSRFLYVANPNTVMQKCVVNDRATGSIGACTSVNLANTGFNIMAGKTSNTMFAAEPIGNKFSSFTIDATDGNLVAAGSQSLTGSSFRGLAWAP